MNIIQKRLNENCRALTKSDRTFRDMYQIIFAMHDLVHCEIVTSVKVRSLTYGEVHDRAERLAAAIRERIGDGDRYVGLAATNSAEWLVLFWAILRSGNRPYLINLQQPAAFTSSALKILDARAVIAVEEHTTFECENLLFSELFDEGQHLSPLPQNAPFGDAIAITTSGTTLEQKICIYTGANFAEQVLNTEGIVKENPDMMGDPKNGVRHLLFLPLYHIFGFGAVYLWFCFFGATFVFPQSLAPDVLLHTARRREVTHVFAVPLFWHAIEKAVLREVSERDEKTRERFRKGIETSLSLQKRFPRLGRRIVMKQMREIRAKILPDSVRFCISGGSHLKDSTIRFLNALGYPLSNGYGMSEIGITSVELSPRAEMRILSSIGKPFGSVEYRISDVGHLLVRGNSLCSTLIVNGTPRTVEGWFDTGDLMRTDDMGRYYFSGRASDVIMGENGENLNPDLIQQAFSLRSAVNFAVIGDEKAEKPVLVVQLREGMTDEEWDLLEREIGICNAALPLAQRVREIRFTHDALLRPQDIKVSRAYLRREIDAGRIRLFDRAGVRAEETGRESDVYQQIRALFAEILGIEEDTIDGGAHFLLDLGGTSLDYFTLIGELDRTFGVKLPYEHENFGYSIDDFEILIKESLNASCPDSSTNSSAGSP